MKRRFTSIFLVLLLLCSILTGCSLGEIIVSGGDFDLSEVAVYDESPYAVVNNNVPFFEEGELTDQSFEAYSPLDLLGRCGICIASIGQDIMPTRERENISAVKPTAWQSVKYDIVDGGNLYNRCHLIGFQLTAENANEKNLITGTRYMNVEGMLPFENMVADYIKETGYHVMYRVTPMFEGNNLLASGVLMEAYSVEDKGKGVCFCVYCYNVQPGILINYADGSSKAVIPIEPAEQGSCAYILNTKSKRFHLPTCPGVTSMSQKNKQASQLTRESLLREGYRPCNTCDP